jgi:hypothetical protein
MGSLMSENYLGKFGDVCRMNVCTLLEAFGG